MIQKFVTAFSYFKLIPQHKNLISQWLLGNKILQNSFLFPERYHLGSIFGDSSSVQNRILVVSLKKLHLFLWDRCV